MIKSLQIAGRDRKRLEELLGIASRFGLGVVLAQFGFALPGGDGHSDGGDSGDASPDLPRRTRLALEQLGPTFVKLGQILATRGDLLPPAWIAELEQLHSSAPTLPFEALRPAVEAALGQAPEAVFADFSVEPLAGASMAQVHRATLADGRAVVLKIRRPDIRPKVEADLRLIAHLAGLAERASAEARRLEPRAMVRQLADAMLEELDFTNEGRNADRIAEDFADDPRIVVPAIHWEWTSETLLVMDYVAGVAPRDGRALEAAGIEPAAIARLGADVVLEMVLVNGRFHADPHPGNLLCLPGNRITLLDLGMIGTVSPRRREELIEFVRAFATGDADQLALVLRIWSPPQGADKTQAAAKRLIARHSNGPLVLRAMVVDFLGMMRSERMALPPDLLLIFKALVTLDGVLAALVPDFDLTGAVQRASRRIALARLSPEHWSPVLQALVWELAKVGEDAPRLVRAAIRRLEGDGPRQEQPTGDVVRALHGLALAVLLGAGLVAGALLFA